MSDATDTQADTKTDTRVRPGSGQGAGPGEPTGSAERAESAGRRRQRLSTGALITVVGVLLLILLGSTHGSSRFALSNAFDAVQLPTVKLPGLPTVLVCALLCLFAGAGFLSGRLVGRVNGRLPALAGAVAGIAFTVGFLAWAAAGRDLPFPVENQFAGTLSLATPLVFGALCGVLCERAGVVNVAIEGQFLAAAFVAAVVGSVTQSLAAAIVSAMVAGVGMGALLALFAIGLRVNQVVFGVVLNVFASGITGFLFDQLVSPQADTLNSAPVMQSLAIPGLSKIPFVGPVLFDQPVLAYLAAIAVLAVWLLLYKTTWGLRIRSVGEHPQAAEVVGISVIGIRWGAVLAGGALAGLGGAFFTVGATGSFDKDFTVGNGFIALAALIMGRWHPGLAALMALFFGFVTQLGSQMQTLSTPVPSQFLLLLPYLATIVAVAGLIGRVRAPAADGEPYEKE